MLANVGSVRSYGIETGVTWQIARPVTLTASYVYDDSIYRNNVVNAAGVVTQAIKGKQTVDTPHNIANLELAYEADGFYARGNINYMSKRYFTNSNDQSVPDLALIDAKIGYRFTSPDRWLNGVGIEASVTNLTDKKYVATVGSNGFGFAGDNPTLLAGASRQGFVTVSKAF